MFGSQVLEVAIGLLFLYLLLSLICSSLREGIEAWLKTRAIELERGIRELLHDRHGQGLTKDLYTHPLVYGLFKGEYDPTKIKKGLMPTRGDLPSYIPSRNFALALMDIVARGPSGPGTDAGTAAPAGAPRLSPESLRTAAGSLANPAVRRALLAAIDAAQGDLARAQANMEAWFDSAMDRVSGWYKRRTQRIVFVIAVTLSVVVNADTLTVAQSLAQNEALRRAVVAEAEAVARDKESRTVDVRDRYEALSALGFPMGWSQQRWPRRSPSCEAGCVAAGSAWVVVSHLPGWLATALAVSLGAPFWFDMLNKFMVIRSTVKPHEKSPEEASEDRQRPAASGGTGRRLPAGAPPPERGGSPPHHHAWAQGDPREGVL